MLRKILIALTIISICGTCISGCKEKSESEADANKTMEQYKAEAEEEITEENMEEELQEMEEAVEKESQTPER